MTVGVEERREIEQGVRRGQQERDAGRRREDQGPDEPRRLGARRHPEGDERQEQGEPAGVLGGRGESGGGSGPGKIDRALPFVRAQGQQQRQRDEERHGDVREHEVRLADVQRHHRHQAGGQRRAARAPAHPDPVDQQHGERAEEGGERARPQIEVRRRDLLERRPIAFVRAGNEAQTGDAGLQVDIEARVVEEMRVEIARLHHPDGAIHDLGFVDPDVERDAGPDPDEAQRRGEGDDGRQRHDRRAHIAGFAPLSFCHSHSQ